MAMVRSEFGRLPGVEGRTAIPSMQRAFTWNLQLLLSNVEPPTGLVYLYHRHARGIPKAIPDMTPEVSTSAGV